MKYNILYYLIFLSILLSCKKDKVEVSGTASAIFEGRRIDFVPEVSTQNGLISITLFWYKPNNLKGVEIWINTMPFKVGSNTIYPIDTKNPNSILFTLDDDLSLDDYPLLDGTVSIDKIDQKNKIVSGTFDLTFVIDTSYKQRQDVYPDTIRLIDGVFESRFK
jgi:hypothetical protein